MLKKIKVDAENLIQEYSMILKSFEGVTGNELGDKIKTQINKHIDFLSDLSKLVDLPEECIIKATNVPNIEEYFEEAKKILKLHKDSYEIYFEAVFQIQSTLELISIKEITGNGKNYI